MEEVHEWFFIGNLVRELWGSQAYLSLHCYLMWELPIKNWILKLLLLRLHWLTVHLFYFHERTNLFWSIVILNVSLDLIQILLLLSILWLLLLLLFLLTTTVFFSAGGSSSWLWVLLLLHVLKFKLILNNLTDTYSYV